MYKALEVDHCDAISLLVELDGHANAWVVRLAANVNIEAAEDSREPDG